MRKKVKDIIARKVSERKQQDEREFREFKREEKNYKEIERFRRKKRSFSSAKKSGKEQERTFKLLSRGIPSYLYKNLHKSMM